MSFNFKFDMRRAQRFLDNVAKKQAPFAMSKTLNDVAFEARRNIQKNIKNRFELTKPFIPNQVRVKKSHKTFLQSETYMTEKASFMAIHEEGGTRKPERKYIAVRDEAPKGKAGIPSRLIRKKRHFQIRTGVYRRIRKTIQRMWAYVTHARYKPRPFFAAGAEKAVENIEEKFYINLNKAVKGGRR